MNRPFAALVGAGAILSALMILVFVTSSATPSYAVGQIGTVAIDTDITGNTVTACNANGDASLDYPCNDSTTLGTVQACASIAVGDTVQIDIVGMSIPDGGANGSDQSGAGAGQSDMALNWSPAGAGVSPIAVTAKDFTVALVHQGDDDVPFSQTDAVGANAAGESGNWKWSDIDINPDLVGEGGPGIAARLTIKGVLAGTATLSLGANNLAHAEFTDIHGNDYPVGTYGTALIVVGSACPTGPTPTPAPSATPSPTPAGPTPTPCTVDCVPTDTPSPTPSPTPVGPTPTPCSTDCVATDTPSPTAVVTATPTPTSTATPVPTTAPTNTPTHTPTPTPTPHPSGSGTGTVSAASGSPTPKSLPQTGGATGSGDSLMMVLAIALGALLITAAGASVFAARAKRD